MTKKRGIGLIIIPVILILISGAIIASIGSALLMAPDDPNEMQNILSRMGLNSIKDFYRIVALSLALYLPLFIGGCATLMLKEWGRKVVCVNVIVLVLYSLFEHFILRRGSIGVTTLLSYALDAVVLIYLNLPKVREQFKRA